MVSEGEMALKSLTKNVRKLNVLNIRANVHIVFKCKGKNTYTL